MIMNCRPFNITILCLASTLWNGGSGATAFEFPFLKAPSWGTPTSSTTKVSNAAKATDLLDDLNGWIGQAPKNGIDTRPDIEQAILSVCQELESVNPTAAPAKSDLMNGFWKLLWTNFTPAAPSSGKLGPFVGTVYQDLDLPGLAARNILKLDFPPIAGELFADPMILNDSTVSITFVSVGNKLAGIVPFGPKIQFETGKEVRLWEHVYLDDTYRVLYARRADDIDDRGAVFCLKRAEAERFQTNV